MTDKAQSLVPQILTAHDEYINSSKGTLEFAFKAGELLNLAKETIKADNGGKRGKWGDWLKEHCAKIPQSTANIYMRLADGADAIRKQQRAVAKLASEDKLSIRAALKLIPKTPEQIERANAAAAKRQAKKAEQAKQQRSQAINVLFDLAPDELFYAVRDVWDNEKLGQLTALLKDHLNSKGVPPPLPPPMPDIPAQLRRL
jgi:hypothetical protein